jgi:carbon-monoxide dehydrogenase medium subunit
MVHDAEVEIIGPAEARRNLNISDFLLAPGRTVLGAGELVAALIVCRLGAREFSTYRSFTERRALDLAFAGVAARLGFEEDGRTVKSARLALGAVGPTVIDALEAANILQGQEIGEDVVRRCAQAAADVCSPISDHRASADYRRHLIKVLVGDCLSELDAQRRAAGGDG